MSSPTPAWKSPYDPSPGSSTPSPDVPPAWGLYEIKVFFWLAVASTAIIATAGVITWLLVAR